MSLESFVIPASQPQGDSVTTCAWDGRTMVVAKIPKFVIEDALGLRSIADTDAIKIVRGNAVLFERIVAEKYSRGEGVAADVYGAARTKLDVTLADIVATGERLSDGILRVGAVFTDRRGRFGPPT
jgi:hypothetical protein